MTRFLYKLTALLLLVSIFTSGLLFSSFFEKPDVPDATAATLSELRATLSSYTANLASVRTYYGTRLRVLNIKIAWLKIKLTANLSYAQRRYYYTLLSRCLYVRRVLYSRHTKAVGFYTAKIYYIQSLIWKATLATTHKEIGVFMDYPYKDVPYFEQLWGHRLNIFLWYQSIGEDFDKSLANWLWSRGTKLELAFEPRNASGSSTNQPLYRLKTITAGQHDAELRRWARQIKSFGHPVYFRPMCEMNGDWTTWAGKANGNVPTDFIPAWRHIFNIFKYEGATNAMFVWSPNRDGDQASALRTFNMYYPGSSFVHYVGMNGYNWGTMYKTSTWTSTWQSFSQVFGPSYQIAARYTTKPIMVAEMATTDVGGSKGLWIKDAYTKIKLYYPRIKAVVWFNVNKETDWRIQNSSTSLAAFRTYAF